MIVADTNTANEYVYATRTRPWSTSTRTASLQNWIVVVIAESIVSQSEPVLTRWHSNLSHLGNEIEQILTKTCVMRNAGEAAKLRSYITSINERTEIHAINNKKYYDFDH